MRIYAIGHIFPDVDGLLLAWSWLLCHDHAVASALPCPSAPPAPLASTPWIVVGGHRPMYTSEGPAPGDHLLSLYMREHLDSMFAKHKVNLMLTGHYHSYQRSCAVLHSTCATDGKSGTVHVVEGTAGGTLDTYYNASWPKTDWSKQTYMGFGYSKIVANRSKLVFTYNATKTAQLLDSVTLDLWN